MHPPYGKEINIPYAGSMYPDPTNELSKSDLGQMPWEQFIKTLNKVVYGYSNGEKNISYNITPINYVSETSEVGTTERRIRDSSMSKMSRTSRD